MLLLLPPRGGNALLTAYATAPARTVIREEEMCEVKTLAVTGNFKAYEFIVIYSNR
jgi:hypothetical protein